MKLFSAIGHFISKNERKILTVVTIGAEVVAIVEAFREAPKFEKLAAEIKEKQENGEEIDKVEVAKKALPSVLKVGIPFTISAVSAILNHKKATDTIQSLTSLLMLARESKEAYKEEVAADIGEEKAEKLEAKADAKVYGNRSGDYAIDTGHGTTKFLDDFSKRTFYSDANFIEKTVNELNKRLIDGYEHNGCILLNEFYEEIGLPALPPEIGEDKVWSLSNGLIRIRITSDIGEDNQLYAILYFTNKPQDVSWSAKGW